MDVAREKAGANEQLLLLYKNQYEAENRVLNQPEDPKEQARLKAEEERLTKAIKAIEEEIESKVAQFDRCVKYETTLSEDSGTRLKADILETLVKAMQEQVEQPRQSQEEVVSIGPLEFKGVRWQSCRILFPTAQARSGTSLGTFRKDEIFNKGRTS